MTPDPTILPDDVRLGVTLSKHDAEHLHQVALETVFSREVRSLAARLYLTWAQRRRPYETLWMSCDNGVGRDLSRPVSWTWFVDLVHGGDLAAAASDLTAFALVERRRRIVPRHLGVPAREALFSVADARGLYLEAELYQLAYGDESTELSSHVLALLVGEAE